MVVDWLLGIGLQLPAPLFTFGLPAFGGGRGGKLLAVCCDCAGLRPIKFGAKNSQRKMGKQIMKLCCRQTKQQNEHKLHKNAICELPIVFGEPYGNCCLLNAFGFILDCI